VAFLPGSTACESPSAVAVHVDGDMESVWPAAFRLFTIPPARIHVRRILVRAGRVFSVR
jgi:hypothetical protein